MNVFMNLVMNQIMNRLTVAGPSVGGGGYVGRPGASI
jgi:hypothetical protein